MNLLGHEYVAASVIGHNSPWLVAGSELPDLVPFVPQSVFSFSEIHEGLAALLPFVRKEAPFAEDLILGALAHSVAYGADAFNSQIAEWLLGSNDALRQELARDIVNCSGVSYEVALKNRLHNYLWIGIDLYLLKNKPAFIKEFRANFSQIDFPRVISLLAKGFQKDESEVGQAVNYYFSHITLERLTSFAGFVAIWQEVMAGLSEKDVIDVEKTKVLFEKIYTLFENEWGTILERVIADVRSRMAPFLEPAEAGSASA